MEAKSGTSVPAPKSSDPNKFRPEQCRAALVHFDPEQTFKDKPHFIQLLVQFFGLVWNKQQLSEAKELPANVETVFICGSCRDIVPSVLARTGGRKIAIVPVLEFTYFERECDFTERAAHAAMSPAVSYRRLALRIPGLESTNDRLVPLSEDEDWYATLSKSQEWYELMHANHQDAPALRTGTYASAAGPLPRSVWLQRCSTVFREPTQVFNEHHHRLQEEQRKAESTFLPYERDPNIMLIQRYDPTAIIGAHSDKTVDLENLVFRAFSAYEGFSKGRFDDPKIQVDPHDYRVWVHTDPRANKRSRPFAIRFLTLRHKESDTTIHVPLPPNWMFVMCDQTHRQWTHEIRKQPTARARISVTSRFSATLAQYADEQASAAGAKEHAGDSKSGGNGKGAVQLYRAAPFTPERAGKPLLDRIGELHLANHDESLLIDKAYKEQNIFRDRLPNYDRVRLCTRNPGDLRTPAAFLSASSSQKKEGKVNATATSATASSTSASSSAKSDSRDRVDMDCTADGGPDC